MAKKIYRIQAPAVLYFDAVADTPEEACEVARKLLDSLDPDFYVEAETDPATPGFGLPCGIFYPDWADDYQFKRRLEIVDVRPKPVR